MNQLDVRVVSLNNIALQIFELVISSDLISQTAKPGQFLHIKTGSGVSPILRRPISICDVNVQEGTVTLVFRAEGKGTAWLSERKEGDSLDVLGPLGNGYPLHDIDEKKHALLIGGGIGVPPLYFLAKKLHEKGVSLSIVLGFQSQASSFYTEAFQELGETIVMTADGSLGRKGFVTNGMDEFLDQDPVLFACGPSAMLRAVGQKDSESEGYFSLEERMGCGIGACFACVCASENRESGYVKICKDGPVFPIGEVVI